MQTKSHWETEGDNDVDEEEYWLWKWFWENGLDFDDNLDDVDQNVVDGVVQEESDGGKSRLVVAQWQNSVTTGIQHDRNTRHYYSMVTVTSLLFMIVPGRVIKRYRCN